MSQSPEYQTRNRRTQRNRTLYDTAQRPVRERQPIGASQELKARQQQYSQSRYFHQRPDVYDDMDQLRPQDDYPVAAPKKRRKRHTGLWTLATLVCWVCIGVIALFISPQLLGVQYAGMPSFAFVGGSIVAMDQGMYSNYVTLRKYMNTDAIFPGVTIDGLDVGGMTRDQAVQALSQVAAGGGGQFNITIQVGNGTWNIDSSTVPMERNIQQVVDQAWSLGRSNTMNIRGTSVTPFQERVNAVSALRSSPVHLNTSLTYDRGTVYSLVEAIVSFVNRDPVNAQLAEFNFSSRSFGFTDDQSGAYLDKDMLYHQVVDAIDSGNVYAVIQAQPEEILADITKTELMNSFELLASYTTSTTSNQNRNTNIDLSAKAISGIALQPGEVFSFNEATGQRTYEKGYRAAAAIAGGQSIDEIGGGVCQTSSTLFNAVARANLEIVERSPHAWPSNYVDKGMDATVNWPNLDFRFRNNTEWPIFIVAYYGSRKVTVEIYGMTLGEGISIDLESKVTRTMNPPSEIKYVQNLNLAPGTMKTTVEARKGYMVDTYKVWYRHGQEIKRELLFTSTYKTYQETVEWN